MATVSKKAKKWIRYLFIIGITIYLVLSIFALVTFNYAISTESFGNFLTSNVLISILVSTVVDVAILESYVILKGVTKPKKTMNIWFLITVLLMILSFTVGLGFIADYLGKSSLDLVLYEGDLRSRVGNITCIDSSGTLIVDNAVTCNFLPKLHNFTANTTFNFINGTSFTETTNNTITFNALSDVKRIGFLIVGFDENNSFRKFEVSNDFTFYTKDDIVSRNEKRLIYFLGLLGIVAFSIPSMMVNLRKLYENRKD